MSTYIPYLIPFLTAFLIALLLTPLTMRLALEYGAYRHPKEEGGRHVHKKIVPRLGGVPIFIAFFVVMLLNLQIDKHLAGMMAGAFLLLLLGGIDDVRKIPAWLKLLGQLLAAGIIVGFGVGIAFITNPLGGIIDLATYNIPVLTINNITYHITLLADVFTVLWIVLLTNTINFLDGLDGLAGGISFIALLVIFFLSISPGVAQPQVAMLAAILAGAVLAFLIFNFHPAKIFLGDSGSYFLGFTLATLAIISGGKIATLFLVLGVAIIDAVFVPIYRLLKSKSPLEADTEHLHHKMIKTKFNVRQTVAIFYAIAAIFGGASLFLKAEQKFLTIIIMAGAILALIAALMFSLKQENRKN